MKNIFYILLLLPTFIFAQYQGNANQKITLGEQTTADGLVYRGITSDTSNLMTNKLDTSAYLVLDTITEAIWLYRASTTPKWNRVVDSLNNLQGQLSLTSKVTGTLPIANGGTGQTTLEAAGIVTGTGTPNYIPKFTSSSAIGNSSASDDGTTFDVAIKGKFTGTSVGRILTLNATNGGSLTFETGDTAFADMGSYPSIIGGGSTTDFAFNTRANSSLTLSTSFVPRITILSDGNVGIGTASPEMGLHLVKNHVSGKSTFYIQSVTSYASDGLSSFGFADSDGTRKAFFYTDKNGLNLETNTTNPIIFHINGSESMRIRTNSEVGIGFGSTDNGAFPLQVNGQIFATNATIATSDEKFKENITPINKGLEIVNKLKPVTFNFISNTENNFSEYEEVGFIAQDVDRALSTESFAKSIVKAADDSEPTSTMGLATQNLIPILVKAIQEQNALIKALEQRILTLENK